MNETVLDKLNSIQDIDVSNKRILIRLDLNVPMAEGKVSDNTRLERVLPTLQNLSARDAKVIILSHFGRPKGERKPDMSLEPVANTLAQMLSDIPVHFAKDCIGEDAQDIVQKMTPGQIAVLENLRFHSGEEKNDLEFSKKLSKLGDIYVNDAFSAAHRAHASTSGLAAFLPAYAGPSLMAEIKALTLALETPKRPVVAVVGGAKISTKIPVLTNLIEKVDKLIIGGGMANTFLFAQEKAIGQSLCEPDFSDLAKDIMANALAASCDILLPSDVVVAKEFKADASHAIHNVDNVPDDGLILDLGPQSIETLKGHIAECKTLLWNGPLGAFEIHPFGEATFSLAKEASRLTQAEQLITIAGGGDTVAALNQAGVSADFSYISTAGGAFLEWLEGKELPGISALIKAH